MKVTHRHNMPFKYLDGIIVKSGDDDKIYKGVVFITSGDWTDSVTQAPVRYTSDVLKNYGTNWSGQFLNLDHSWEALKRVGWVENVYYTNGAIKGDIRITRKTTQGKDAIASIDAGLVNGLSVEVASNDIYDFEKNIILADELDFVGCAIVTHPACSNSKIR